MAFVSYDAVPQSNGTLPNGAKALASASLTVPLVAGKTNGLNVALQGIIVSIEFSNTYSFVAGSAGSQPLTLPRPGDADGNLIVAGTQTVTNGSQTETDTFANPMALSVADTGGFTKLSKNGGPPAATVTVDASSDSIVLEHSAGTPPGYLAKISASSAGVGNPGYTSLAAFSASLSAQTLTANGPSATITAIEAKPQFGFVYFTIAQANSGTSACPVDALAFSQLAFFGPTATMAAYAPGTCTIQVSDGSATIALKVTIAAGTTQPVGHLVGAYYNLGPLGQPANSQIVTYSTSYPGNSSSFSTPPTDVVDGIAADPSGDVYVSATQAAGKFTLEKYAAGVRGSATPEASIALSDPVGVGQVAVDGAGNVYVTLIGNGEVAEYTSSLSTQVATLSGSNTGLFPGGTYQGLSGGLAADAAGNLYVGTGPPAAPTPPPTSSTPVGFGIALFAPLGPGVNDTAPVRTLSIARDGGASEIAVDPGGDIFFDFSPPFFTYAVTEYPAGTNSELVTFPTQLGSFGFAVEHGQLYVSTQVAGSSNEEIPTNPGYFSFDVANPSAEAVPFINYAPNALYMTSY